jgi:glycerol-3-phosphate O-acyltransferase
LGLTLKQEKNKLNYFLWLLKLLRPWIRFTVNPKELNSELEISPSDKICYVLRTNSLMDLLVLWEICRKKGLPEPLLKSETLFQSQGASYVEMRRESLFSVKKHKSPHKFPFQSFFEMVQKEDSNFDIKLVPVSIFWGRNPGRDEKSIFKLLFFDNDHAGFIQKLFIVLAQGRSTFVSFGKPISMLHTQAENASQNLTIADLAKKVTRVLKIHFRLQRNAALGPQLPSREQVMEQLLRSSVIKDAILDESRKKKISEKRAEQRAKRYIKEVISNQKYSFIRIADVFMTWFWNRIFNGVKIIHSQRLREIDPSHEIIYMPSHRSHMDYLLLAYVLYYEGMVPPHTAAGVNLNFWPVGPLLRMGGAFYLRRTFSGNRMYAAIFSEYVHYLVGKGHPIKFYLEGGRSRTGRLLPGKTGLLSMIVQSYLKNLNKPVAFVPIYVGYDKVMEVRTYQSELRGAKKQKESISQIFKARSELKSKFGKAYISFGEPIFLKDFLDNQQPDWRSDLGSSIEKPKWLSPVVASLADCTLRRINQSAVVSPMGVFSLVMMSVPAKALPVEDLVSMMDIMVQHLRRAPYSPNISLEVGTGQEILQHASRVFPVKRFQHPSGDVIYVDNSDVVQLGYYRSNIMHLLALPALLAAFFINNTLIKEETLKNNALLLYPFLHKELFLGWSPSKVSLAISEALETLLQEQLLVLEESDGYRFIQRPDVMAPKLSNLMILAGTLGTLLERCSICFIVLLSNSQPKFRREDFEKDCVLMARRVAILGGTPEAELFEKSTIGQFLSILVENEYLDNLESNEYVAKPSIIDLESCALGLLSQDIRQSVLQLARNQQRNQTYSGTNEISNLTFN